MVIIHKPKRGIIPAIGGRIGVKAPKITRTAMTIIALYAVGKWRLALIKKLRSLCDLLTFWFSSLYAWDNCIEWLDLVIVGFVAVNKFSCCGKVPGTDGFKEGGGGGLNGLDRGETIWSLSKT